MPPVRGFRFNYCEEPNSDLLQFLKYGSPDSVKHFAFGYDGYTTFLKPIDYYFDEVESMSRRASEEVFTAYWTYSKESLQEASQGRGKSYKVYYLGLQNGFGFRFRFFRNRLQNSGK